MRGREEGDGGGSRGGVVGVVDVFGVPVDAGFRVLEDWSR